MFIPLKDNQYKADPWKDIMDQVNTFPQHRKSPSLLKKIKDVLLDFDEKSLTDLAKKKNESGKYLIFPTKGTKSELDNQDIIYSLNDKISDRPTFRTGNIMGFFRLDDDVQIHITSRFDDSDKNFFLHYMLQKVCNVAFTPKTDSFEDSLFDFMCYLFPTYLNEALKQGIFRAYITHEYNDANVRGPIDVSRHIRFNIPFNGKIAYHTREYTIDNHTTQLIRHTIEYIRALPLGHSVLSGEFSNTTRDNIQSIERATESYNKNLRLKVISKNLKRITHPYYTAYEPLRKLCLAILLHKKISYGENAQNPISGILFDGASLWEEYLATIICKQEKGFIHSNNRLKSNGIHLFKNGGIYYPDFYRRQKGALPGIVLDAKYKKLAELPEDNIAETFDGDLSEFKPNISREDLFQMLAYIHCIPADKAFLLFPIKNNRNTFKSIVISKAKEALGQGGKIAAVGIPIPQGVGNFADFSKQMEEIENHLNEFLKEC